MNIISSINGEKLDINKKETYRNLGYHFGGEVPVDEELEKMVDELTEKIREVITPRCAYEIYSLKVSDNTCMLSSGTISDEVLSIRSSKLSAHIRDCRYAILFAATIGPGADMLIRRFSGRSTIKPAILQAAGAAAIEAFADQATEIILNELDRDHLILMQNEDAGNKGVNEDIHKDIKFKMRFSPGYGDFSLEYQRDFFRLLQLEKNLGMSLNSALLMSPSKSITAVIGVM